MDPTIENADFETDDLMRQIGDVNLSYLLLAQRMVCRDKAVAIYRLGISSELAEILANLSPHQVIRVAMSNQMPLDFRFSNQACSLKQITQERLLPTLNQTHASILMAAMPVENLE